MGKKDRFTPTDALHGILGDEEQFKAMVDALPMAIYTTDAEGNLTYFNPAAVEFSGKTPEIGTDKWCVTWKLYWPDGSPMPHDTCPMAIALKEKRQINGAHAIAEKPNGERVHFEAFPSPILDNDGNLVGGINMLIDITKKVETQENIKSNEERMRLALDAGEIGFWEWNIKNNTILWSEILEKLHGLEQGEFSGRYEDFIKAIHPDDREKLQYALKDAIQNRDIYEIEHRWVTERGEILWFKGQGKAIYNSNDEAEKMIGTCINITGQKQSEQLREIQTEFLEKLAVGNSVTDCLQFLCESIGQINSNIRAAVLLADEKSKKFEEIVAPQFSSAFKDNLIGKPINDKKNGTCIEAIMTGEPVISADIENDDQRTKEWRDFCIENGFYACRSNPIKNEFGQNQPLGSFLICFKESREPNDWEIRISDFATQLAGIALNREFSRVVLKENAERFQNTIEQSPLSMQIFDSNGNSILVNPAWEKMWDVSKEDVGNYNILKDKQLKESGLTDKITKAFKGAAVQLPSTYYDPKKIGKKGRERWIDAYLYPLTSVDSKNFEVALIHHDITDRKQVEQKLLKNEANLEQKLSDYKLLQEISTLLIEQDNPEKLFDIIVDAAVTIMRSDFASLQILYPERGKKGELYLQAYRGFTKESAEYWKVVTPDSKSTCGIGFKTEKRTIIRDVEASSKFKDSRDLELFRSNGIRAVQTTPLKSREGKLLGMISTHWSEPHSPGEDELNLLDVLARQAADLIEKSQAKKALSISEKMYRALFESMDEGYCVVKMLYDENGNAYDYKFLEVNPAFKDITGISNAQGNTMLEVYPDQDPEWFKIYDEVAKTKKAKRFERQSKRRGDNWFSVYVFPYSKTDNSKVGVLFSDITEKKNQEHAASLLSSIVENSDDAIISKDLNSIITSWNKAAEKLFGYTAEEAIGKHITLIFPEDRIKEEDEIVEKMKKGERIDHFETVRQAKDGTLIDISLTISPILNKEGEITGASKISRNITQQKQAQIERNNLLREVENERQMLSEVFQNAPSFMAILEGPNHTIVRSNDFFYKLVGRDNILGKTMEEALPEIKDQGLIKKLDQVYQSGKAYSASDSHIKLKRKYSDKLEDVYIDFVYQPIRNLNGDVTGIFVQGIDLTERNKAKAELEAVNETLEARVQERTATLISYQEQLRALASQLSKAEEQERERLASDLHDNLGQLLAVGKMKIDLLQKENHVDEVAEDINDLASLMDDAIRYTRQLMTDLKPPPSLDKENLHTSINWIVQKMKKHNLHVQIQDDGKLKPLSEEVLSTLRQCVQELLFNVVKHAKVNEAVIRLSRDGKMVKVIVEDKGIGMDTDLSKLKPSEDGGFGLFNITERISLLGGGLEVESTPNEGTKMILTAPLYGESSIDLSFEEAEDKIPEKSSQTKKSRSKSNRIKVLVCDDHPMMREGLRKMIEEEEDLAFVAEATNGEDAIELALELKPDVIVMDVNMPGMNGIEATREIISQAPNIRIVGLSLHDNIEVSQAMRNAGASAYLTKADVFESLCATIRSEAKAMNNGIQNN